MLCLLHRMHSSQYLALSAVLVCMTFYGKPELVCRLYILAFSLEALTSSSATVLDRPCLHSSYLEESVRA